MNHVQEKKMIRVTRSLSAMALALAAFAGTVQADYPEKPVEFIVPWPPGDLEDVLTRMIADRFQQTYGVPAAVVNKPGGGGGPFPGAVEVANAPADGYTIGSFVTDVPIGGPQIGIPELSPNPFEPLGIFLTYPFVIAAGKDAPYSDWAGLAAYAQENEVSLGHFGDFLPPTKVTFAAARESGFEFASSAAFDALDCNTLASGDAEVINTTLQQIMPCKDDIRILASIGGERIGVTPDVPTVKELHPDLALSLWNGLFVTKGVPQVARDKIIAVAKEVMASPEAAKLAADTGALVYWIDADAAVAQIEADTKTITLIEKMLGN
jgi:tripartite-type tricarboxylate transporter receptor subunit TctC